MRVIFISLSLLLLRCNVQSDEYHKQGIPGVHIIMVFQLSLVPPRYNAQSDEYHKQGIPGVHSINISANQRMYINVAKTGKN